MRERTCRRRGSTESAKCEVRRAKWVRRPKCDVSTKCEASTMCEASADPALTSHSALRAHFTRRTPAFRTLSEALPSRLKIQSEHAALHDAVRPQIRRHEYVGRHVADDGV